MDPNTTKRTRSGRLVKPPERYEPTEQVEDDYSSDEYDTDEDESDYSSEEESDDGDSDDSEGSLKDFVVSDSESESESET